MNRRRVESAAGGRSGAAPLTITIGASPRMPNGKLYVSISRPLVGAALASQHGLPVRTAHRVQPCDVVPSRPLGADVFASAQDQCGMNEVDSGE